MACKCENGRKQGKPARKARQVEQGVVGGGIIHKTQLVLSGTKQVGMSAFCMAGAMRR